MKKNILRNLAWFAIAFLSVPAFGQIDFTGEWAPAYHEDGPERLPGPELGDYMGIPLTDAGRLRADSYDADRISVETELQCRPHSSDYGMRGLGNLRVTRELGADQNLIAFETYMPAWGSVRTIWLDGRPHPPAYAQHTFQGFSTGVWEGNMLTVTTTHLTANYLRRNGVASSDKRIITEHWTRHGDFLTVIVVVEDPVMLTEPWVRSENWYLDPGQKMRQAFCEYAAEVPAPPGAVPHHLPGKNAFLTEVAEWYGLPAEATRGGAKTMYPEYRKVMPKPINPPPEKCERFCVCTTLFDCNLNETVRSPGGAPAPKR
jgi:hypothetical protein